MFVPSFDALGAANPFGALMSQLIGNQPSLFHSQDGSTTTATTEEEGVMYGVKFDGGGEMMGQEDGMNVRDAGVGIDAGGDGHQLQRWEQLFQLLEIQNQQQLILQREQHERRVSNEADFQNDSTILSRERP